jgi:type IV secretory pathway VirB4 component
LLLLRCYKDIHQEIVEEEIALLRSFLASPYAVLFHGDMEIKSGHSITILDLFGVQNYPEKIREAIAFCVIEKVRRHAFNRPDVMSYVILDEVAQLLRSEHMREMVQELFSLARKYRTSVWAITQKYESYVASSVADTLRGNSVGQLFLSHASDTASMTKIVNDFGFSIAGEIADTTSNGIIIKKLIEASLTPTDRETGVGCSPPCSSHACCKKL